MRFHLVTLFPEFFDSPLSAGLMGKAREAGIVDYETVNPRDFAQNKHHHVDDRPYGGSRIPGASFCSPRAAARCPRPWPGSWPPRAAT